MEGKTRGAKYRLPGVASEQDVRDLPRGVVTENVYLAQTPEEIRRYIKQPLQDRAWVDYNREFLYGYRPNETFYLTAGERSRLHEMGRRGPAEELAGTYAKNVLSRLLIDLSWASSRLEGSTYSMLETKRLINFGQSAKGKDATFAQMILNHKEAIEFLVESVPEIGFDSPTVLNLHRRLARNLLSDPRAIGSLRHVEVGIGGSKFNPLALPQQVSECFDKLLASAASIEDPFEQSFFVMVQLPYLQPFEDVNKRVTRLAANIPLILANLAPLTFVGVEDDEYKNAILGVYELNQIRLLKEVFLEAYEASARRYAAIRSNINEADPLQLKYRDQLQELVHIIVVDQLGRRQAFSYIEHWAYQKVGADDREAFREMVEEQVLALHEGNCGNYQIRLVELMAWQEVWNRPISPDLLLP